jgi:cytochrome c5
MLKVYVSRVILGLSSAFLITACANMNKKDDAPTAAQVAQQRQAEAQTAQQKAVVAEQAAQGAQDQVVVAQMAQDREAYVQRTKQRIANLTQRSDELHQRAAQAMGPEKIHLQNSSSDFDDALTDARRNLAQVETVEPRYWLDQKRGLEKAINKAEAAYEGSVAAAQ